MLIFLASLINFALAGIIFFKRINQNRFSIWFAFGTIGIGLWGIFTILLNINTIMLWERLLFVSSITAIFSINIFSLDYLKTYSKFLVTIYALYFFLVNSLVLFTELVIRNVSKLQGGGISVELGEYFSLFTVFIIISIFILLFNLYKGFSSVSTSPLKKQQLRYIVIGITSFIFPALLTNLILPILGVYNFNNLGVIFSIFFTGCVTIAIVRYRLFSIRTLMMRVFKIIAIGLTFFVIVLIQRVIKQYFLNLDTFAFEALLLDIITAITVAVFIPELIVFYERNIGSLLNSETIQLQKILRQIDEKLNNKTDIADVKSGIKKIIEGSMDDILIEIVDLNTNPDLSPIDKFMYRMNKNNIVVQELDAEILLQNNHIKPFGYIAKISATTFLTVKSVDKRTIYSKDEIEVLLEASNKLNEIFIRLDVYEKITQFNLSLTTKIQEATKDLETKNQELEESLRKERDMMDILGHELRTPLSIARNSVSLVDTYVKNLSDTAEQKLEKIIPLIEKTQNSLRREVKLLETILSSTKIENEKIQLNHIDFDVNDTITASVEFFSGTAEKKGLKLLFKKSKENIIFNSDKERFHEVIDNLIDNAIKYTEKGFIMVEIKSDDKSFRIEVSDTGVGIPKEDIPNLGKKFFRVNNYLKDADGNSSKFIRPGGTGIGLYVVFGLVKMMGGKIEIESEEGKGSKFTLTFNK